MSWSRSDGPGWTGTGLSTVLNGGITTPQTATTIVSLTPPTGGVSAPLTVARAEPATIEPMRQMARAAYRRGAIEEAGALQQRVLDGARAAGQAAAEDFLFLGLIHYARHDLDRGVATLRDGLAAFPKHASIHENLAVFLLAQGQLADSVAASLQALALGSDSPNVFDCLSDAYNRLGRRDEAIEAGRKALVAKDRRFGTRPPLVEIPQTLPPAFNPHNPAENVIAYCLWGNDPRYHVPLLENARIRPHLFPTWTIRVYHDDTVDPSVLSTLASHGVELRQMGLSPNVPAHRRLLWRFEVVADPTVRRFLCRDADSLLNVKERVAVDAWLMSDRWFHAMRDWYTHTDLLLAGMWGGVGNVLPPVPTLLSCYTAWRVENDHVDQDVLSETVWPTIRNHVLIHDSVFAPCLGSVPFPPYGALPDGSHVGQNAFLHFARKV